MKIRNLEIKNYRAFGKNATELVFEMPDGNTIGSGLTILIGPNNAGKSTVLTALLMIDEGKRIAGEDTRGSTLRLKLVDESGKDREARPGKGASIAVKGDSDWRGNHLEVIKSRRPWAHRFDGQKISVQAYGEYKSRQELNTMDSELAKVLKEFEDKSATKKDFTNLMKRVIPGFSDWSTQYLRASGDHINYRLSSSRKMHEIDLLGDGTINIFSIVAFLLNRDLNKTLIVDEPELSLHPQAQKRLFEVLKEFSKDKQVIITTHSPYFVDASVIKNIRKFELKEPGPEVGISVARKHLIVNEPSVFTPWHRDLFFENRALFVEGTEDYKRLKKFFISNDSTNIAERMYPIYGKHNVKFFRDLCKDFNIVCAFIVDVDFLEKEIRKIMTVPRNNSRGWYKTNFSTYESLYRKHKANAKRRNIFIWSKPDIKDVLDEEGYPLAGMDKEIKECVKLISR